jgi:hypothetical protein
MPETTPAEIPLSTKASLPPTYDFNIEDALARCVEMLERWGGTPVRTYVIAQYGPRNLRAAQTAQMLDLGVTRGLLETWFVSGSTKGEIRMVGLAGRDRTPYGDGSAPASTLRRKAGEPMPSQQEVRAGTTAELLNRQYARLSQDQRDEIARLIRDGEPSVEIQRAYGILSGVVGRIKHEYDLAPATEVAVQPPSTLSRKRGRPRKLQAPTTATADYTQLESLAELFRNAPPIDAAETAVPPRVALPTPANASVIPESPMQASAEVPPNASLPEPADVEVLPAPCLPDAVEAVLLPVTPLPVPANTRLEPEISLPSNGAAPQRYTVTLLIEAADMGEAYARIHQTVGTLDVLSITKATQTTD